MRYVPADSDDRSMSARGMRAAGSHGGVRGTAASAPAQPYDGDAGGRARAPPGRCPSQPAGTGRRFPPPLWPAGRSCRSGPWSRPCAVFEPVAEGRGVAGFDVDSCAPASTTGTASPVCGSASWSASPLPAAGWRGACPVAGVAADPAAPPAAGASGAGPVTGVPGLCVPAGGGTLADGVPDGGVLVLGAVGWGVVGSGVLGGVSSGAWGRGLGAGGFRAAAVRRRLARGVLVVVPVIGRRGAWRRRGVQQAAQHVAQSDGERALRRRRRGRRRGQPCSRMGGRNPCGNGEHRSEGGSACASPKALMSFVLRC